MEPRGWFVGVVLVACAVGAAGTLAAGAQGNAAQVELSLVGIVRVHGGKAVAILAEKDGARRLPVVLTNVEASQIESALRGPRGGLGLTSASLEALGGRVLRASIDGVAQGKLRGHLALKSGAGELLLDAGAGEALALALQAGAPIVADAEVLDEAGISLADLRGKAADSKRRDVEPAPVLDI